MTNHENPFRNPETIDNTRDEIAAIYEQNVRGGRMKHSSDLAAKTLKKTVFEETPNPREKSAEENIVENLRQTEILFNRIGIKRPTVPQLEQRGVNFSWLEAIWEEMEADGMEPQLVVAPHFHVPYPWDELYNNLACDKSLQRQGGVTQSSLLPFVKDIHIDHDLRRASNFNWQEVDHAPYSNENGELIPRVSVFNSSYVSQIDWTVRVIAGTAEPTMMGEGLGEDLDHPTISEYLTLQALKIQKGERIMDEYSFTWLAGTFNRGEAAPVGTFVSDKGFVSITSFEADVTNFPTLGRRVVRS